MYLPSQLDTRILMAYKTLCFKLTLPVMAILWTCLTACSQQEVQSRPNILLIVADDMGYADIGSYGGDIETPVLDTLAARGIRFSRFHTSPICSPSRAMLLTGNDNHIAGIGVQNYRSEYFGYEGELSDRTVAVPEVLKRAGYQTYIAGKWHLGLGPENDPVKKGFDKSFVSILGASHHFTSKGLLMDEPSPYTENGQPASWEEGRFSTDLYTDKLISFIESGRDNDAPFFAYAAYTAPHWPLQVEDRYRKKYEGRYDAGYEVLRENRLVSLKEAGMIPPNATLPELHPLVIPWDSLSPQRQKEEARKMEIYAGMIDNMDENIGRIISYLKEIGEYENTLIVFLSDNGAADEDYFNEPYLNDFLQERNDNSYENMGKPNSFVSYGPPWAEAGTAPFRYFKGYLTEGGITAPMIIAGPGIQGNGSIYHGLVTIMDLAPTFYEVAQTSYPDTKGLYPLKGASIMSYATGKTSKIHPEDYIFAMEHNSRTMLRQGNWKITQNDPPLAMDKFELYNLENDLGEQNNLTEQQPEKHQDLIRKWESFYRIINGEQPPE